MFRTNLVTRAISLLLVFFTVAPAQAQSKLYWGDYAQLNRTGLDSFSKETLLSGVNYANSLAYDAVHNYLYIGEVLAGRVLRMRPDGSELEELTDYYVLTQNIALNLSEGKFYVASQNVIRRHDLDGSNRELVNVAPGYVLAMAIDTTTQKMYWTEISQTGGAVYRANMDGSDQETVVSEIVGSALFDLALDLTHGKLYIGDLTASRLYRANLDGSSFETIFTGTRPQDVRNLTLDISGGKVYWSDGSRRLNVANLDGTSHQIVPLTFQGEALTVMELEIDAASNTGYFASYGWSDGQKLYRMDMSTLEPTLIYTSPAYYPGNITFDRRDARMYWSDPMMFRIFRSNFDGSEREVILHNSNAVAGIAVDEESQTLYWVEPSTGKIHRSKTNGDGDEEVVQGLVSPYYLAADFKNRYLYFSQTGRMSRVALNDSAQVQDIITGLDEARAIFVDPAGGKLYALLDIAGNLKIVRANLDGTALEDVIVTSSEHTPYVFAPDFQAQKLYWLNINDCYLHRANLDGSNAEEVFYDNSRAKTINLAILPDTSISGSWNGYLGMTNVLEVTNLANEEASVRVTLNDLNGQVLSQTNVSLAAGQKQDFVLNEFAGFTANSYGTVTVDAGDSRITGSVVQYAPAEQQGEFDFALNVPLALPLQGTSYINSNGLSPTAGVSVKQWLELANLSSETSEFTIRRYDAEGSSIEPITVTIPAGSRRDVELPGTQDVALLELAPESGAVPYLAVLYRYGLPENNSHYSFAMSIQASTRAHSSPLFVSASTGAGAENWVEIVNPSSSQAEAALELFDQTGRARDSEIISIPPRGQRHFHVNSSFTTGETGMLKITPVQGSLIAQSVFYFLNNQCSAVSSAYSSFARESQPEITNGSYNLYLGMKNWLKVINLGQEPQTAILRFKKPDGEQAVFYHTVPSFGGTDIALHETASFGLIADTYGSLSIETESPGALYSEVVRLKPSNDGTVDFAVSLPMN